MAGFNHTSGHYLEIDGAEIYYEELENKGKPYLLILHGGFESIENMNSLALCLSSSFHIIGIDSRGHGKSTLGTKQLSYKLLQSDIEAVLKHLDIKTVSIIGFSDGGITAYRITAEKNVKVEKLVTIGSSWSKSDVIAAEETLLSITPENAKEIFAENYARYMEINPEPDYDLFTESVIKMWLDKTDSGHPDENVKNIETETLLIRGDNDFLVSLASLAELKTMIDKSSLMNVPFAEHVAHEEQPQLVQNAILQFLKCSRA